MVDEIEPSEEQKVFGRLAHDYYALVKPEDLHKAQEILEQIVSSVLFMRDKPEI